MKKESDQTFADPQGLQRNGAPPELITARRGFNFI